MSERKNIIYVNGNSVVCSGENNDHPTTQYSVPHEGFVVCKYCNMKFARENAQ